jgi:hypothetical protein
MAAAALDDAAFGRGAQARRKRFGRRPGLGRRLEAEAAGRRVGGHQAPAPAIGRAFELVDRQGVEELVGDDQRRAGGNPGDVAVPSDWRFGRHAGQRRALFAAQRRARFHQMNVDRGAEFGRGLAGGAQRVGHQRAAAGAELDQPQRRRRPHGLPDHGAPQADELAEDLADFRRGDEIALGAQRVAAHVVAVLGMAQRLGHEAGQRDRPLGGDDAAQMTVERAHTRPRPAPQAVVRRRAQTITPIPNSTSGSDRSCPMVAPAKRNPRWASGWRNSSTNMRATP